MLRNIVTLLVFSLAACDCNESKVIPANQACQFEINQIGGTQTDLPVQTGQEIAKYEVRNFGSSLTMDGIGFSFTGPEAAHTSFYGMEDAHSEMCCIFGTIPSPRPPYTIHHESGVGGKVLGNQTSSFRLTMNTDHMSSGKTFDVELNYLRFFDTATGTWCNWSLQKPLVWHWTLVKEKWCPPNGIGGGQPPAEDQMITNGGEVLWRTNVSDDNWNCGDCGVECNLVTRHNGFGRNICENGICYAQCNDGYADCDKVPGNACDPLPCP